MGVVPVRISKAAGEPPQTMGLPAFANWWMVTPLKIIGGLALMLDNFAVPVFAGNGWSIALVCAGLLVALEAVVRLLIPEYRRPIRGTLILAVVLFGVGLGGWIGWGVTWPLVIIAIGVSILVTGLRRGR